MGEDNDVEVVDIDAEREIKPEAIFKIPGMENRFNAAAWRNTAGNIMLLARHIFGAAPEGEPDKGPMVVVSLNKIPRTITPIEELKLEANKVVSVREVWRPKDENNNSKDDLLEDGRAIEVPDGKVLVGLTSVRSSIRITNDSREKVYHPYPALCYLSQNGDIPEDIGKLITVITEFGPGKNMTPIDQNTFVFRQEGVENNHKLMVLKWDGKEATAEGILEFPDDLDWASFRIGTGAPPIWINDHEALMTFHGIKKIMTKDENGMDREKYIYSIGIAKLERDESGKLKLDKNNVYRKPILIPDDFEVNGEHLAEELHSSRSVVYLCGALEEEVGGVSKLDLFPNVSDNLTVGARFSKDSLKSLFTWSSSQDHRMAA